jgi:hypothetical protein
VLRHGIEIRERLWERFWTNLEKSLKSRCPNGLAAQFVWERDSGKWGKEVFSGLMDDECLGLDVRLTQAPKDSEGLRYRVEAELNGDQVRHLGFGLCFQKNADDLARLKRLPQVSEIIELLERTRLSDEPEWEWWAWWQYWDRDIRKDTWLWFADGGERSWEKQAKSFWGLVEQSHELVAAANKALKRY